MVYCIMPIYNHYVKGPLFITYMLEQAICPSNCFIGRLSSYYRKHSLEQHINNPFELYKVLYNTTKKLVR